MTEVLLELHAELIEEEKVAYIDQYAHEFDEKTIGKVRFKQIQNFLKLLDQEDFWDTEDEEILFERQDYYEETLSLVFNIIYCSKKHHNELNLVLLLRLIEKFYKPDNFEEFYRNVKEVYCLIYHGSESLLDNAVEFFWPIVFASKAVVKLGKNHIIDRPEITADSPVMIIIEKAYEFNFIDHDELQKLYTYKNDTYLYLRYRMAEESGNAKLTTQISSN